MRNYTAFVALTCLAFLHGCSPSGPPTYTVTGEVTYNGQPLSKGQISFMPKDGQVAPTGGVIVDGKYTLSSLPGDKHVEITASREEGQVDPAMGKAPQRQYIPAKYNTATTLDANVTSGGPNKFDFHLKEE